MSKSRSLRNLWKQSIKVHANNSSRSSRKKPPVAAFFLDLPPPKVKPSHNTEPGGKCHAALTPCTVFFLSTNFICVRTNAQTGTCFLGRPHSAYASALMGKNI